MASSGRFRIELDGDRAKRDVDVFAHQHRMRASEPFHRATEHIVAELRRAGLTDVEVLINAATASYRELTVSSGSRRVSSHRAVPGRCR